MDSAPTPPGSCALCQGREKLLRSHILPRFVYRALAVPGEDGPVAPLLCGECEDRFSLWESQFARDVFHPRVAGRARPVKYGPWLLKFGASVCWRVLEDARRNEQLGPLERRWSAEWRDSLEVWRVFLRGRRPDVGDHHLYLAGWDGDATDRRAIAFDVIGREDVACVEVEIGPLTLVGVIGGKRPEQGSAIHLEGKLKRRAG